MIRLLHLSDIHFRAPWCLNPREDRDSTVRQLIIDDAISFKDKSNINFDAILVTGDIAYSALAEEFESADNWFTELSSALGIAPSSVFVVPGNHDINRRCADKLSVQANKKIILAERGENRLETFSTALKDPNMGASLLEPFAAYNDFARKYGCNIEQAESFWEYDIAFCKRYTLKLNGLTTTFFSDSSDNRANLFMGGFQANLTLKRGIINLAMFHHPFDWLSDGDEIADQLSNSAKISLVGHKHRQRVLSDHNGVIFSAAATNPSRTEGDYKPGYNIIDLSIREDKDKAWIEIEGHLRSLQDVPAMFIAKKKTENEDSWSFEFEVPRIADSIDISTDNMATSPLSIEPHPTLIKEEIDKPHHSEASRLTSFRFWSLKESQRRSIATQLNIFDNAHIKVLIENQYIKFFELVASSHTQEELIQLIQTEENKI